MTPERWREVESVFSTALELEGEAQIQYLAERCEGDVALRLEVESLLSSAESATEYFEGLAGRLGIPSDTSTPKDRMVGKRIGHYRIVRLVGRGGMGAVYLAERDDRQFEMRAALKLLPVGLDSDAAYRRFGVERQILARLEHRGIARLLDGGVSEDGTPYFLMEYVEGVRLDSHCDEHRLTISERLELFLDVCDAVQHAHQNLVVHRDIKPSNIMVTESGVVKLLDFGIARMLDSHPQSEPHTLTQRGQPMTLAYAAPEQVRGGPVTTASDVYALGLILYRLLCGRHAHRFSDISPTEIERVICEDEPPPPSVALMRKGERRDDRDAASPQVVAERRGLSVQGLLRTVAGDLDTITMAALRKDPQRRYVSVSHLADDIRRYRAGLPVSAHKDTLRYRVSRFVGRNKIGVAIATVFGLLLAALVATSIGFAVKTKAQSEQIAREAATTDQVSSFLTQLFEVADPVKGIGDTLSVRTILDQGAERLADELKDQPDIRARMMFVLGSVYGDLGLYDEAIDLHRTALEIRKGLYGDTDPKVAESLESLGNVYRANRTLQEAVRAYGEALEVRHRLDSDAMAISTTMAGLASALRDAGQPDSALFLMHEVVRIREDELGEEAFPTLEALGGLAYSFRGLNQLDSAEALYRKIIPLLALHGDSGGRSLPSTLNNLAYVLKERGDYAEAESTYREALAAEREYGVPATLAIVLNNLGAVLAYQGKWQEAEDAFTEGLAVRQDYLPAGHWRIGGGYTALGLNSLLRGDTAAAEGPFRQALAIYNRALGPEHVRTALAKERLATSLTATGGYDEAERLLLSAIDVLESAPASRNSARDALARTVALYEAWGKPEKARVYRARIDALVPDSTGTR